MQLRSNKAEHQTANPFLSLVALSLSHCTPFGSKDRKTFPFLPFSHSLLFLKYLTSSLLAFRDFCFFINLPLYLENSHHLRINTILYLTPSVFAK
uniref:Uncharacterized protein n=1 Tax=Salix viminalis TaxID=40686 RepID=A0A6N2KLU9_SALVM